MIIGVVIFDIHLPAVGSLKGKRKIIKSLKDRIRNKFNVSVAEIEAQDLWQKAVLAAAIVSPDKTFANSVLSKVSDLMNGQPEINVTNIEMEWL